MPPVDLAIPAFGGQNHVSIDGEHGPSRKRLATAAPACEGIRPREGPRDRTSTSQSVCGDTARRPAANESSMNRRGCISRAHRKKPKGRSMPETMRRANGMKSQAASKVEHMFAEQKSRMGLVIRTMGIAPAMAKIGLANPAYGMKHLTHLDRTAATKYRDRGGQCRSERRRRASPSACLRAALRMAHSARRNPATARQSAP